MTLRPVLLGLLSLSWALGCQNQPPARAAEPAPAPNALPPAALVTVHTTQGPPAAPPEVPPKRWFEEGYPERFDASTLKTPLPRVSVNGNRFVDEAGNTVVFQGVSIADPDKLLHQDHWSPEIFEEIARWGANVVRIPVHPAAWREEGRAGYFALLDQAVLWANQSGLYLIIDWHSIGNLKAGLFQHAMYDTSQQETYEFWRSVSHRYKDVTTVALYEVFNEPTVYGGTLGAISWDEWKGINEEIISLIRAQDEHAVPLVAGFNWAYDLEPVAKSPIARPGVGYVSHPYPMKVTRPFEKKWDEDFGFVAKKYPLIATEIGYMRPGLPGAHNPVLDDGSYGPEITDYLAKRGASWVAWCFDPEWSPQLIKDWTFAPTESGEHFRKVMLERKANEKSAVKPASVARSN